MDTPNNQPRGRDTREALVLAAIEAFGRDGYDAVSIRRLAEAADANTAMISYYFGGKEGLYGAAVQHIADRIHQRMDPVVRQLESLLDCLGESLDSQASYQALCRIIDGMLEMLVSPESTTWARIILREQQDPSPHFQTLYKGAMSRIMAISVQLVALSRGRREAAESDRLTAMTLMAQVVFFRTNHAAILQAMEWDGIGEAELAAIRRTVHDNVARILGVDDE